jgi:phospholipase/carboxylesterase
MWPICCPVRRVAPGTRAGSPSPSHTTSPPSTTHCLLTELLLRTPRPFAGAALLTGGFFGPPGHRPEPGGSLDGTPVLLASSRHDTWVPLDRVDETAVVLRERGAKVDRRVYDDLEHLVSDDAVTRTRELLTAVR